MEDLLLPAYQKLYAALQSLERFNKGQDLFDNIACIDSFLSEFRNVTFVLQKSLAHTEYKSLYDTLRDKYLRNDDCSWLVEKRNSVLKEKPFCLEKTLKLTLYLPNGAGVFSTEAYTIDDEKDYTSLTDMVKRVIQNIPAIEVFFSTEFVYKEKDSDRNIFSTIGNGIDYVFALLKELGNHINIKESKTRSLVDEKIKSLHFHSMPKDAWFVDDYAFYRKDQVFEKGERFEVITPFKTAVPYSILCDMMGVERKGHFIEETFLAFEKMHIVAFSKQRRLMPTILTLDKDGIISMVMFDATIKTTTYRKINKVAENIKSGTPIVAVFHVGEMLCYSNLDVFKEDYSYRSQCEHIEILSFNLVTRDSSSQYCISSDSVLNGNKDCIFPTLTKVETDNTLSFMNPIVNAFKSKMS